MKERHEDERFRHGSIARVCKGASQQGAGGDVLTAVHLILTLKAAVGPSEPEQRTEKLSGLKHGHSGVMQEWTGLLLYLRFS